VGRRRPLQQQRRKENPEPLHPSTSHHRSFLPASSSIKTRNQTIAIKSFFINSTVALPCLSMRRGGGFPGLSISILQCPIHHLQKLRLQATDYTVRVFVVYQGPYRRLFFSLVWLSFLLTFLLFRHLIIINPLPLPTPPLPPGRHIPEEGLSLSAFQHLRRNLSTLFLSSFWQITPEEGNCYYINFQHPSRKTHTQAGAGNEKSPNFTL